MKESKKKKKERKKDRKRKGKVNVRSAPNLARVPHATICRISKQQITNNKQQITNKNLETRIKHKDWCSRSRNQSENKNKG